MVIKMISANHRALYRKSEVFLVLTLFGLVFCDISLKNVKLMSLSLSIEVLNNYF